MGWEPVNTAERRVWDAFRRGAQVDLGDGDPAAEDFDIKGWQDRRVRGEFLSALLLGVGTPEPGYIAKVRLLGAHITGGLSMNGGQTSHELLLVRCWFDAPPDFTDASTRAVAFVSCRFPGLAGSGWRGDASVAFNRSCVDGRINVGRAHIAGFFELSGATLRSKADVADTVGAHVAGQLELNIAKLATEGPIALLAERLEVGGSMLCSDLTATDPVLLAGAQISGGLFFDGASLSDAPSSALDLTGISTPQLVLPSHVGSVDLERADVGSLTVPSTLKQTAMRLTGLTYTEVRQNHAESDPIDWVHWVGRDPSGFHPQPYEQLAAYYRSLGQDGDARRALLAKRRHRRAIPRNWRVPAVLRVPAEVVWQVPGRLVDLLAGYGYAPSRAAAWFAAAVLAGFFGLKAATPQQPTSNIQLNTLLLALDSAIPTSPFGLRAEAALTDTPALVAISLQALGSALALAVLPALSRALFRGDY